MQVFTVTLCFVAGVKGLTAINRRKRPEIHQPDTSRIYIIRIGYVRLKEDGTPIRPTNTGGMLNWSGFHKSNLSYVNYDQVRLRYVRPFFWWVRLKYVASWKLQTDICWIGSTLCIWYKAHKLGLVYFRMNIRWILHFIQNEEQIINKNILLL